jgi:hypothetical protein
MRFSKKISFFILLTAVPVAFVAAQNYGPIGDTNFCTAYDNRFQQELEQKLIRAEALIRDKRAQVETNLVMKSIDVDEFLSSEGNKWRSNLDEHLKGLDLSKAGKSGEKEIFAQSLRDAISKKQSSISQILLSFRNEHKNLMQERRQRIDSALVTLRKRLDAMRLTIESQCANKTEASHLSARRAMAPLIAEYKQMVAKIRSYNEDYKSAVQTLVKQKKSDLLLINTTFKSEIERARDAYLVSIDRY